MANVYIRRRPASVGSNRIQDWALVTLAIWLFISPWVLQFGGGWRRTRLPVQTARLTPPRKSAGPPGTPG